MGGTPPSISTRITCTMLVAPDQWEISYSKPTGQCKVGDSEGLRVSVRVRVGGRVRVGVRARVRVRVRVKVRVKVGVRVRVRVRVTLQT